MLNIQPLLIKTLLFKLFITIIIISIIFSVSLFTFKTVYFDHLESRSKTIVNACLLSLESALSESIKTGDDLVLLSFIDRLKTDQELSGILVAGPDKKITAHTDAEEIGKNIDFSGEKEIVVSNKTSLKIIRPVLSNKKMYYLEILKNHPVSDSFRDSALRIITLMFLSVILLFITVTLFSYNIISGLVNKTAAGENSAETVRGSAKIRDFFLSVNTAGVLILDNSNKITFANSKARGIYGNDISGRNIFELKDSKKLLDLLNSKDSILIINNEKYIII